jgi:hypothetical protein
MKWQPELVATPEPISVGLTRELTAAANPFPDEATVRRPRADNAPSPFPAGCAHPWRDFHMSPSAVRRAKTTFVIEAWRLTASDG